LQISRLIFAAASVFLAALFGGCGGPSPTDLEGVYTFTGSGTSETLELKQAGAFSQTIDDSGRIYKAEGTWSLQNSRNIKLLGFLVRFDTRTQRGVSPREYLAYNGYFDQSQKRIVLDDDGKYFLNRK
jgi:hypothetical protein